MVLEVEDFVVFRANWGPKHESLISIANELNLGLDSFVFVDDNPPERALVEAQLPEVAVPDVGSDIARFPFVIEAERYFEPLAVSREDLTRSHAYRQNAARVASQQRFADYGEYLDSLQMVAEIGAATPVYFDRIAQLTNKTNQFNLTTRRYTLAQIESLAANASYLCLYGKLTDHFGDHGLISVISGRVDGAALHIELWLMSCRVLKREMEIAMLDILVEHAQDRGIKQIIGYFRPTAKNALVADMYDSFGFTDVSQTAEGSSIWSLDITDYSARTPTHHVEALTKVTSQIPKRQFLSPLLPRSYRDFHTALDNHHRNGARGIRTDTHSARRKTPSVPRDLSFCYF